MIALIMDSTPLSCCKKAITFTSSLFCSVITMTSYFPLLLLTSTFSFLSSCPLGWIPLVDSCYLVQPHVSNWNESQVFCWNSGELIICGQTHLYHVLGGYLVEISSDIEMELIETYILQNDLNYWIGLTDVAQGSLSYDSFSYYFQIVQRASGAGQSHTLNPAGPTGNQGSLMITMAMRTVSTCTLSMDTSGMMLIVPMLLMRRMDSVRLMLRGIKQYIIKSINTIVFAFGFKLRSR